VNCDFFRRVGLPMRGEEGWKGWDKDISIAWLIRLVWSNSNRDTSGLHMISQIMSFALLQIHILPRLAPFVCKLSEVDFQLRAWGDVTRVESSAKRRYFQWYHESKIGSIKLCLFNLIQFFYQDSNSCQLYSKFHIMSLMSLFRSPALWGALLHHPSRRYASA